jgi:hypothetical protein
MHDMKLNGQEYLDLARRKYKEMIINQILYCDGISRSPIPQKVTKGILIA